MFINLASGYLMGHHRACDAAKMLHTDAVSPHMPCGVGMQPCKQGLPNLPEGLRIQNMHQLYVIYGRQENLVVHLLVLKLLQVVCA